MELDKAWMGKGAVPKHLAAPAMKLDKASLLLGRNASKRFESDAKEAISVLDTSGGCECIQASLTAVPASSDHSQRMRHPSALTPLKKERKA